MINEKRRVSFDSAASMYEEARPSYPEPLIDDILELSGFKSSDRILEIGAGTGKATEMFARRGHSVLAIEPGKAMAAIAEKKFHHNPKVVIELSKFEDWETRGEQFGLVTAAQSFHWIDPGIKYHKPAEVLKPKGFIALFWNKPYNMDREIWTQLDTIYRDYFLKELPFYLDEQAEIKSPDDKMKEGIEKTENEIKVSGKFKNIQSHCYNWISEYQREDYLKLLNTYSDHRTMESTKREELFLRVGDLIDSIGGKLSYPYVSVLHLAEVKNK